jgi:hypothetical protein
MAKEVKKVCKKNLIRACIIGDFAEKAESTIDSYVFVKVKDVSDFHDALKNNNIFDHVFKNDDDGSVCVFSDSEIEKMEKKCKSINDAPIRKNSFVLCKSGLYQGLCGIVIKDYKQCDNCDVLFRFYTRTLIIPIKRTDLQVTSSLGTINSMMKSQTPEEPLPNGDTSECMSTTMAKR